jgi:hypothetical protein
MRRTCSDGRAAPGEARRGLHEVGAAAFGQAAAAGDLLVVEERGLQDHLRDAAGRAATTAAMSAATASSNPSAGRRC